MRTSRQRPKALPNSVWGWIVPTFRYKQDEVVAMAGYDAAMYLRILAFGKLSTLPSPYMRCLLGSICPATCGLVSNPSPCEVTCRWPDAMCMPAGCELFFFVTLWVAIVVLPTNLSVSRSACLLIMLHTTVLLLAAPSMEVRSGVQSVPSEY